MRTEDTEKVRVLAREKEKISVLDLAKPDVMQAQVREVGDALPNRVCPP